MFQSYGFKVYSFEKAMIFGKDIFEIRVISYWFGSLKYKWYRIYIVLKWIFYSGF